MKKTPKQYAESLKALHKTLTKKYKPLPRVSMQPLDALVRGAMSYDVPEARAQEAMEVIAREFVDLNELRVATDLEIEGLVGTRFPQIARRAMMITVCLNLIFEKEHTLSLERLKTLNKRDARTFLRELTDIHPFVEAYVMLFGLDAAAVPVDDRMMAALKEQDALSPEATLVEAQKFLEYHLKADEYYSFYSSLRQSLDADPVAKKSTKSAR